MYFNEIKEFPAAYFGDDIKREVRVIVSPETTGEENMTIVSVKVPPKGVSEGHIHKDFDEYIYFDNSGTAIVDGIKREVGKNSLVIAPRGKKHECRNESESEDLNLLCLFVPPLIPYGKYPELIKKTKDWLNKEDQDV
jgi:quercetin dioxygenase-like cupin family protein